MYEAVGFQNGNVPEEDARACGILGVILINHFIDRINLIYSDFEHLQNKKKAHKNHKKKKYLKKDRMGNLIMSAVGRTTITHMGLCRKITHKWKITLNLIQHGWILFISQ